MINLHDNTITLLKVNRRVKIQTKRCLFKSGNTGTKNQPRKFSLIKCDSFVIFVCAHLFFIIITIIIIVILN